MCVPLRCLIGSSALGHLSMGPTQCCTKLVPDAAVQPVFCKVRLACTSIPHLGAGLGGDAAASGEGPSSKSSRASAAPHEQRYLVGSAALFIWCTRVWPAQEPGKVCALSSGVLDMHIIQTGAIAVGRSPSKS